MYAPDGKGSRRTGTGRVARGADIKSPPRRIGATQQAHEKLQGFFVPEKRGPQNDKVGGGRTYFTVLNRFSISAQFTTFHQAVTYSARRFWYLR